MTVLKPWYYTNIMQTKLQEEDQEDTALKSSSIFIYFILSF